MRIFCTTVALMMVASVVAAQADPTDFGKCQAAKLNATGKKAAAKLKCYAKAAKSNEAVDPDCLSKAEKTFVEKIGKAEEGTCLTNPDAVPLEAAVDDFVDATQALLPGMFRRVFISSTTSNGNLGGLAGADATCQSLAEDAGLGGTWIAWLSSSSVHASSRMTDAVYVELDGTIIANSLADLTDCSIDANITLNESGATVFPAIIFTGTDCDGTNEPVYLCSDWTSASGSGLGGKNDFPPNGGNWTGNAAFGCDLSLHLYCFEH